jgi:hypothetical protein
MLKKSIIYWRLANKRVQDWRMFCIFIALSDKLAATLRKDSALNERPRKIIF